MAQICFVRKWSESHNNVKKRLTCALSRSLGLRVLCVSGNAPAGLLPAKGTTHHLMPGALRAKWKYLLVKKPYSKLSNQTQHRKETFEYFEKRVNRTFGDGIYQKLSPSLRRRAPFQSQIVTNILNCHLDCSSESHHFNSRVMRQPHVRKV